MQVVPATVGEASRRWDDKHLALSSAAEEIGGAPTSGLTGAVDKLRATRGDLSVSVWSLPAGGLLVTVHGPCVDVPEEARSDWTREGSREPLV